MKPCQYNSEYSLCLPRCPEDRGDVCAACSYARRENWACLCFVAVCCVIAAGLVALP